MTAQTVGQQWAFAGLFCCRPGSWRLVSQLSRLFIVGFFFTIRTASTGLCVAFQTGAARGRIRSNGILDTPDHDRSLDPRGEHLNE
jgi:hypothetical protein